MADKEPARIAGVLLLGVFALNLYIGIFDTNLKQQLTSATNGIPLHWYLNWAIAAVTLIAAFLLLTNPLNALWVSLSGIVWPIVYVGSLGFDVYTKMCAGGGYCWPSRTAAFEYLILNNPNANGGGWILWSYTIPTAIGLLFIAWALSIWALYSIRRDRLKVESTTPPTVPPNQQPPIGPGNPSNQTYS